MGNELSFHDMLRNCMEICDNIKNYFYNKYTYFNSHYEIVSKVIKFKIYVIRRKYPDNVYYPSIPKPNIDIEPQKTPIIIINKIRKEEDIELEEIEDKEEEKEHTNNKIYKKPKIIVKDIEEKRSRYVDKDVKIDKKEILKKKTEKHFKSIVYTKSGNEYVIGGDTYSVRDLIKTIEGWKYIKNERLWTVPVTEVNKRKLEIIKSKQLKNST